MSVRFRPEAVFDSLSAAIASPADLRPRREGLPARVDHRRFQTPGRSQADRGTCWAFAACAALEAAYARTGRTVSLSPHYYFHVMKAHHFQGSQDLVSSFTDFGGGGDAARYLDRVSVPLESSCPYLDFEAMESIVHDLEPEAGSHEGHRPRSRDQIDAYEWDLRHVPLAARLMATHRAAEVGVARATVDAVRQRLAAGYDVVLPVAVGDEGHVVLAYGYDDAAREFLIKDSAATNPWQRMRYAGDPTYLLVDFLISWITRVADPEPQRSARWLGRWETDHDGHQGVLLLRHFAWLTGVRPFEPSPAEPLELGTFTWTSNGAQVPVVGWFEGGGSTLHARFADLRIVLSLHAEDLTTAGGTCEWRGQTFGMIASRNPLARTAVDRDPALAYGVFDLIHDGRPSSVSIPDRTAFPQQDYVDTVGRERTVVVGQTPGQYALSLQLERDDGLRDLLQVFRHTQERDVLSGVSGSQLTPAPARLSLQRNLYCIAGDQLVWRRHRDRARFGRTWDERVVGTGWSMFTRVVGLGDGALLAVGADGGRWYRHLGRADGAVSWLDHRPLPGPWARAQHVVGGPGGVIYVVDPAGRLQWYRHLGHHDGNPQLVGPHLIATGWNDLLEVAADPHGALYRIRADGTLQWFLHQAQALGRPGLRGPVDLGADFASYRDLMAVGNGYLYACVAPERGAALVDLDSVSGWVHHHHREGTGGLSGERTVATGWGTRDGIRVCAS